MKKQKQSTPRQGFTLVEIAIVLVIIGLLLGGILKGQELINNAKVRAITDRQNSLKVAWFAFIDRFASLPGDYVQAPIYISGAGEGSGDGRLTKQESVLAMQHLSSAGYLRCSQCTYNVNQGPAAVPDTVLNTPKSTNSLTNNYGGVMSIWNDGDYYFRKGGSATATTAQRLMIHTGPRIPSNILAEVDRKIDDGSPSSGDMVANIYDPVDSGAPGGAGINLITEECVKGDAKGVDVGDIVATIPQYWRPAGATPPVWDDCGASVFI